MSSSESVTQWLSSLKRGNPDAAQRLWQRYLEQLVRLARKKLGAAPRRVADEEDVAAEAFASFCRAAEDQRFSRLEDRDDLWQVLLMLTEREAIDQLRRQGAEKRGAGAVRGESALVPGSSDEPASPVQPVDREPTPEDAAEAAEQLRLLLDSLEDDSLRRIALAKLEGYSNEEIAGVLGVGLRTIERRLNLIRKTWEETVREE
jgi:RNA polymerase sigma factor (sigma-70 family)